MARDFTSDDDDPHFQLGVEHGYADAPRYHWHESYYQERYETGYACGRWRRIVEQQAAGQPGRPFLGPRRPDLWDDFCEHMRWKGCDRDR